MTTKQESTTSAGFAMYLELTKGTGSVTQVLVMPEGISSSHKETPVSIYRRRISTISPRKTWRYAVGPGIHKTLSSFASPPILDGEEVVVKMTGFITTYLESLANNDWKLRNQLITVEVTAEDLEDARNGKTPHKVLGRVWKVRKQLGFPKEFLVPPAATTY
jgi:hypothetical protein